MSRARGFGRWLLVAVVLLLGRLRPRREERERIVASAPPNQRAETLVLVLLGSTALCAAGFVVVYVLDRIPRQTQFLGLSLGLAFAFLAAAAVVVGKQLVPREELEDAYPEAAHERERDEVLQIVEESGERLTRKRLLSAAGGGAATALGVALVTPAVSLGPVFDIDSLYATPWRRGRRLVDEHGRPLRANDIEEAAFYAIALYRKPLFQPTEPRPALVCPCHYSTFDPATGGTVPFGPAGRPLPQLPLAIDARGNLRCAGGFSGAIGPSWWEARER